MILEINLILKPFSNFLSLSPFRTPIQLYEKILGIEAVALNSVKNDFLPHFSSSKYFLSLSLSLVVVCGRSWRKCCST
jgi:hypothetical protein